MTTTFRVLIENEHGVVRQAEYETGSALLTVNGTKRGIRLTRTDDDTTIGLQLSREDASALAVELSKQVALLGAAS